MKPEGSLLCSQESATGPCPEWDESKPHLHTILTLSFSLHPGLQMVSSLHVRDLLFENDM